MKLYLTRLTYGLLWRIRMIHMRLGEALDRAQGRQLAFILAQGGISAVADTMNHYLRSTGIEVVPRLEAAVAPAPTSFVLPPDGGRN